MINRNLDYLADKSMRRINKLTAYPLLLLWSHQDWKFCCSINLIGQYFAKSLAPAVFKHKSLTIKSIIKDFVVDIFQLKVQDLWLKDVNNNH